MWVQHGSVEVAEWLKYSYDEIMADFPFSALTLLVGSFDQ